VVAFALSLVAMCVASRVAASEADAIRQIVQPSTIDDVMVARAVVFAKASEDRLKELKSNRADSIALYAAWEELARDFRRYKTSDTKLKPGKERFLGFLEGRLGVSLPRWWEETIDKSSATFQDGRPSFHVPGCNAPPWESAYRPTGIGVRKWGLKVTKSADGLGGTARGKPELIESELRAAREATFTLEEGGVRVRVGHESAILPAKVLEESRMDLADVLLEKGVCFLALHTDYPLGFTLICCQAGRGVLWESDGWGPACGPIYGVIYNRLGVVAKEDRVVVFGAEPLAVYIEAFDRKTGKNLFRFCSEYGLPPD
jgi:hypothetical protein